MAKKNKKEIETIQEEAIKDTGETNFTAKIELIESEMEEENEPEGVAFKYKAPELKAEVNSEIAVGDIVNVNIDHPKFKGKDLAVIEILGTLIFVRAEGTRYGFNKNSVTKAE